jgi:hypothetical protein
MPQVMITFEFVARDIQFNHLANPEQSSSVLEGAESSGGFCDDVWSMWSDLALFWTDLEDVFALPGPKTPVGLLADGMDTFADWYDIWLSANAAMSLTPQSCLPL